MTAAEHLDNALVGQKNDIVSRINRAEDYADLDKAASLLFFARPVWEACGYGYKAGEVRDRIRTRAAELAAEEREYLAGVRKNCRTRGHSETNLRNLESLAGI
jgi:hypothetical protein